ncbi:hypothetical protein [Agromyces bauzanensis]
MNGGDQVFRRLQSAARSTAARNGTPAPTQEYLIRHTLESFLDRLTRTPHAEDFVLKGGILLAAYGVRHPTKDADANAVAADVTAARLATVVRDVADGTAPTAATSAFVLRVLAFLGVYLEPSAPSSFEIIGVAGRLSSLRPD